MVDAAYRAAGNDIDALESYAYVALKVFEEKGAGEIERDFSIEMAMPAGEEWSEDDLPSMLPRLAEIYN